MRHADKGLLSDSISPRTDAQEAYVLLRRTHDAIHRHVSEKLMKWDLSVPRYGVLKRVYDHKELSISYLSGQIFRGNSNMTTLINRMERDGLIQRINGQKDRRVTMIRLTLKASAWPCRHQGISGLSPTDDGLSFQQRASGSN